MHFSITSASLAPFSLFGHISPAWQGIVFPLQQGYLLS